LVGAIKREDVYAVHVPVTPVQSEQLRILQAHGLLTAARMSQILDHDAAQLQWVAGSWSASSTEEANGEVRQIAVEAHTLVRRGHLPESGG
jgi:hypothetical protein